MNLRDRYMLEEEREDDARMRRRDPIKAEREAAFRVGMEPVLQRDGMYWAGEPPFRAERAQVPADEPHSWSESWVFIGSALVVALVVLVARAWGWL